MRDWIVSALPFVLAIAVFFILFFFFSKKKAFKYLLDLVEWAEKNILGSKQGQEKKKKVIDMFYASTLVPWYLKLLPRSVIEGWMEKALSLLKSSIKSAYEHADDHKEKDDEETSASDEEEG